MKQLSDIFYHSHASKDPAANQKAKLNVCLCVTLGVSIPPLWLVIHNQHPVNFIAQNMLSLSYTLIEWSLCNRLTNILHFNFAAST